MQTDAPESRQGAVLSQEFDGKEHPVINISQKLTPMEQCYATIEQEALAIKWAIQGLCYYLKG